MQRQGSISLSALAFSRSCFEDIRLPRTLRVIEKGTFQGCKNLQSVAFPDGSELEEIREAAFQGCGLKSFTAPPSLKKIGDMAFARCPLKHFQLNEGIQEIGWLCLWNTGVSPETLPQKWTPEHLGF